MMVIGYEEGGIMVGLAQCGLHPGLFYFDLERVPTVWHNGRQHAICPPCATWANVQRRKTRGLELMDESDTLAHLGGLRPADPGPAPEPRIGP
jgi:hypothetical protein